MSNPGFYKLLQNLYLQPMKKIGCGYKIGIVCSKHSTRIFISSNFPLTYVTLITSQWRMEWRFVLHLWIGGWFVSCSRSLPQRKLAAGSPSAFCGTRCWRPRTRHWPRSKRRRWRSRPRARRAEPGMDAKGNPIPAARERTGEVQGGVGQQMSYCSVFCSSCNATREIVVGIPLSTPTFKRTW